MIDGDAAADILKVEFEGGDSYRYVVGYSDEGELANWKTVLNGMSAPHGVSFADFNGDGKADIIAVEANIGFQVGISSGTGISSWSAVMNGMSGSRLLYCR